ncbi:uncharacterized protein LY79DRAFT_557415 [Colletotrichum navitas]|uniref:Uncharacterized protein n=1 Tax=Colletotrichum navitas TaxID=681940 RepID=A0AAD8V256_9PEZI|nr:uncharacterized protein LY79DRAFT_557415 [Colletotrichum navitas]KAK1586071.1 hypothetical protein LY79DRAFT_557415 [Colletotrichum navitas]
MNALLFFHKRMQLWGARSTQLSLCSTLVVELLGRLVHALVAGRSLASHAYNCDLRHSPYLHQWGKTSIEKR